jgi:gliding motility associated protien GldN
MVLAFTEKDSHWFCTLLKRKTMSSRNFISLALAIMLMSCSNLFAQTGNPDPVISRPAQAAVSATWRWPLTPNGGYDHMSIMDTKGAPIPWQNIREEDIQWKKRVWREISTLERQNLAFNYAGDENTGGGMLIEILIDAIKTGKIKAYANTDDRFTTVFAREELEEQIRGKAETVRVIDPIPDTEIVKVIYHEFNPATVTKYRLIEDWIFDRNTGQMVVRIAGIAPVRDIYGENNEYHGSQAMFWLYYPDIRNLLACYEAVNPANDMQRETWVEFLEGRRFASRITKVSNPYGGVAGSYGESFAEKGLTPMEALYAGQSAANELVNKEHDMWEY